jgi:hypothetical protein
MAGMTMPFSAPQGVMWQPSASTILFATAFLLISPQPGIVLPGKEPFLCLFLVRSVAVQTFVCHAREEGRDIAPRLVSTQPTSST